MKVKPVKPIQINSKNSIYVKIAAFEIYSENKNRESVVGTSKNICTVAVHCWYIKDAFAGFCSQV